MTYPTDPDVLRELTPDKWDTLLASVWRVPAPREVVRVRSGDTLDFMDRDERRAFVNLKLAEGLSRAEIACLLDISNGLITKILKGER